MKKGGTSGRPRARDRWHFALGVWVAGVAVGFAALFAPEGAARADIVTSARPTEDALYLAHDRGGHIDHHVLYHGIDGTARARMREAEVLFLGNSRLMFALQPDALDRLFARVGVPYYVLGFGHEEQDRFPLDIIRRENLRPHLVVVNADGFFADARSEWAERVTDESGFDAWKVQLEGEAAHRVRRILHRVVPHYVDLRRGFREVVLYRSREDGTWLVANRFGDGVGFAWPPGDADRPGPGTLQAADAFKRELDARNTRLVLCIVPGPNVSLHRARLLAEHLQVPLLVPAVADLRTIDGSHLAAASALAVLTSLFEQLRPHLPSS
jgi:hypothetical protein